MPHLISKYLALCVIASVATTMLLPNTKVYAVCADTLPPQGYIVSCMVLPFADGSFKIAFQFYKENDTTGATCDGPVGFCLPNETPTCDTGTTTGTGQPCNPKTKGYNLWTLSDITKGHQIAYVRGDASQSATTYGFGGVSSRSYGLGPRDIPSHPCQDGNPSYWSYFYIPCNRENSEDTFKMEYWNSDANGNVSPSIPISTTCTCPANTTPGTLPLPVSAPPAPGCTRIDGYWTYTDWGACSSQCVDGSPTPGTRTRVTVACSGASCGGDCGTPVLSETCYAYCPYQYPPTSPGTPTHDYQAVCADTATTKWYTGDPNPLALICVVVRLLNVLVLAVGAIFVMIVFLSAIKFAMAQGDPKALQGAKQGLTVAVIGILVVVGVFAILTILRNVLGLKYQLLTNPFDVLSDNFAKFMLNLNISW